MKDFFKEYFKNKKVLILGFGREGKSSFNILQNNKVYSELAIADKTPVNIPLSEDITVFSGEQYLDNLEDYDIVIKSPGIGLPKHPSEYKCCITSQIELFLKCYSKQTIGITGTKGKSTTASMLYHVLKHSGVNCVFGGNIGVPVFDIVDEISEDSIIVLELSCHQLEHISVSPRISVLLNMYEDHLDRYGTFEVYSETKKNIYRNQKADDILFCNSKFLPAADDCISEIRPINPDNIVGIDKIETQLKGTHNQFNISIVYEICKLLKIDDEKIFAGVASFKPLSHRLEYIGTISDVEYYDDSISTTVESTIGAIKSIENIGTVLIGGMERGIDYDNLVSFLLTCKIDNVIFMYSSGKRIYDTICQSVDKNTSTNFVYMPDLQSSVEYAQKVTACGKACVLSPAAASYGVFKNFEERGNVFRQLLKLDK